QQQHGVAVDDVPLYVAKKRAITVTIEADAKRKIGALSVSLTYGLCHHFRMQRSAIGVDVASVGGNVDEFSIRTGTAKHLGRKRCGGAVGAVYEHLQALQASFAN